VSGALYNEIEPYCVEWLRALLLGGHVAAGEVDNRSVVDLQPRDVAGDGQRHFFAGIGVWSHALRLAGWPDDLPVWTGSCPCQPFSSAGKRRGFDDERHLWPAWFRLIRECRPAVVFGEQVASPDGLVWLDAVRADLEAEGYAFGAADLCAAGVGAPHIRQRLFFVAYADDKRRLGQCVPVLERRQKQDRPEAGWSSKTGKLADAAQDGRQQGAWSEENRSGSCHSSLPFDSWGACEWVTCRDGKARPIEPGTFPLVNGSTPRVGRLRAYGNAIVPQVAATFIRAVMDTWGWA
jgi:DNA (cytosine-5)-methyltransferase 1